MKRIKLEDIKYENIQESFGMGGPSLGSLKIKGEKVRNLFLVDNEKYSIDHRFILLVEYRGKEIVNRKVLKVINVKKRIRSCRIIILDIKTKEIYESLHLGESLFVEEMKGNRITYFKAFHNGIEKFKAHIIFNSENFHKISEEDFYIM